MNRATRTIVLLLSGFVLVRLVATDGHLRYVRPAMGPYLWAAGLFILAVAVTAIVRDVRGAGAHRQDGACGHVRGPDDENAPAAGAAGRSGANATVCSAHAAGAHADHTHSSRAPWLYAAAVMVVLFVAPPALAPGSPTSSVAVAPSVDPRTLPALPAGAVPRVGLAEVNLRAAQPADVRLSGRAVAMEGGLRREEGGTWLGRVVIVCCAADARTVHVRLDDPAGVLTDVADRTWLRVVGMIVPGSADAEHRYVAQVVVTSIEQLPPPLSGYEY